MKPKTRHPLDVRTFTGADRATYVVYRTPGNQFHTFREVEAKDAAIQCGATLSRQHDTRQMWKELWQR